MEVHFAYHHVVRTPQLDKAIVTNSEKLSKLLKHFSPDVVHLHGVLEYNTSREIPTCSLNLSLPSAVLHASETADSIVSAVQECFKELLRQVKKHKVRLRREAAWHRQTPPKLRTAKAGKSRARAVSPPNGASRKAVRLTA
jgi:ribosomal subunit interface protein